MIMTAQVWMFWCGIAVTASAAVYTVAAAVAVRVKLKADYGVRPGEAPAVTILKPLCGDEHELYECLRSFCDQDYPQVSNRVRRGRRRRSRRRRGEPAAARVSASST